MAVPGSLASSDYLTYLRSRSPNPAPTSQPIAAFAAPDPATFARTPGSLYLQDEQQKAIQRGAAARGTLLTGGLQKRLQENAVGLASQDFGNAYNRALSTYTTNRDTAGLNRAHALEDWQTSLAAPGPYAASFNPQAPDWPINNVDTIGHNPPDVSAALLNQQRHPSMPTIAQPFVAPEPAWAQRLSDAAPAGNEGSLSMGLNQRFDAQDAQRQEDARTEAAAEFARQVAAARESNAAVNRIPMGEPLNRVKRVGMAGVR